MIKAVIFDIDGVLLDSFEANYRFFCDLFDKFGYKKMTKEEFRPFFHLTLYEIVKIFTKSEDEEEIKKIWTSGKEREVPYHHELLIPRKDLKETVQKLNDRYVLGIVTGRVRDYIYAVPQLEELRSYFKAAVGYEDTDKHKPHPHPLIFAAKKLEVLPEECVYIGDVESDVLAAKAAGMKSIIYASEILADADANTTEFRMLPEIIDKL